MPSQVNGQNQKNTILSKVTQMQKDKHHMFSLIRVSQLQIFKFKYSPYASSKKLLFVTHEIITENRNNNNNNDKNPHRVVDPCFSRCIYQQPPHLKAQGILQKSGKTKIQRTRGFAVRLCLLVMSEASPIKSCQYDSLYSS